MKPSFAKSILRRRLALSFVPLPIRMALLSPRDYLLVELPPLKPRAADVVKRDLTAPAEAHAKPSAFLFSSFFLLCWLEPGAKVASCRTPKHEKSTEYIDLPK
jgi:hypothetical protein